MEVKEAEAMVAAEMVVEATAVAVMAAAGLEGGG